MKVTLKTLAEQKVILSKMTDVLNFHSNEVLSLTGCAALIPGAIMAPQMF